MTKKQCDLAWLQAQVGGHIETIPLVEDSSKVLVLNENGFLENLPINCIYPKTAQQYGVAGTFRGNVVEMPSKFM